MLEAQEAGRAALVPGALAREVNTACRGPIEAAGFGAAFRHRMGHGIGLDVHERPLLSPEDDAVLEAGMVFTDEPSICSTGASAFGSKTSSCAPRGRRVLNRLAPARCRATDPSFWGSSSPHPLGIGRSCRYVCPDVRRRARNWRDDDGTAGRGREP